MREDTNTEFKREYTPDIKKEVIAFANSGGGVIYVGKDNKGNNYPISNTDEVLAQITNSIRDSILPDVTLFTSYDVSDSSIKITVGEGTNKPYYLADKGIKPAGVYVRQGASSAPASFEQIRQMIKLMDGDKFEAARSLTQGLTFREAEAEFAGRGVDFGESQKRTLGIIGADGLYTNLGVLLSDQCAHTTKLAVFSGTKKGDFKTRKEVDGSLFRQMRSAFDFLSLTNNLAATFSGLNRIEQYDYPEETVREAMLNAIIHRDYSFSGSIIVNIYDDRMEFVSLGGLMPGLHREDLFIGVSQPRNEKLANVFYRLKHIEAYGTGIRKIMQFYEDLPVKPDIVTTNAGFVLTLPNINYTTPLKSEKTGKMKPQHQVILDYLKSNPTITNEIAQKILSVKQTRAYAIIKEMVNLELIKKSDSESGNKYILA